EYFIYDPVTEQRSPNFEIKDEVFETVLQAATKMFYYNRCNIPKTAPYAASNWTDAMSFDNPLQDGNCRYVNDQNNASLEKDLRGGWFDAGDYNKYVTFTHSTLHDLLWAYQENPAVFGDNWNIPESGNGIPDILDEIKWELDWLLKMTNPDGSAHIKMGSISYSENVSSPPSANTDPRYYGPTCTSASISNASVFAHAAKVFEEFASMSAYSNTLKTNATNCWNYVLPALNNNTLETDCDDGTIKAGDADWTVDEQKEFAVGAAVYLMQLHGDNSYNQYVMSHLNDTEAIDNSYWGAGKTVTHDALLLYTTLSDADATVSNQITSSFGTMASNNWENFFGTNALDLYRSYMPDYSYHWGSNLSKARYGILNLQLVNYNINPASTSDYQAKVATQMHYFHGVNPMGLVYLSNLYGLGGDRCVNEIYHGWFADGTDYDHALTSLYGPAPGFLSGGANKNFTVTTLTPPYGQPIQKSYLDFNDDFPNNSWEISEPAIYYQAAYIRLLASQVKALATTVLPVALTYFKVNVTAEKQVELRWKSASEVNNDYYEIQRSKNRQQFETIGFVDGLGNSNVGAAYTAMDTTPYQGISYYRIKQVHFDGSYTYFPIRVVSIDDPSLQVSLQPNPARQQTLVNIASSVRDQSQLEVISADGKEVFRIDQLNIRKGENQISLNLAELSPGIYFVKINYLTSGKYTVNKLVVR
ncbi:MAG: glycoside hydrolase family 9 protein, partial [Saprospiraceae bacterium]